MNRNHPAGGRGCRFVNLRADDVGRLVEREFAGFVLAIVVGEHVVFVHNDTGWWGHSAG